MSEVKRWAINPTGNEIHDISPNWTLENAQAYSDQYGAGYPLVMVVKLNDYEKLKAQLEKAEAILKDLSLEHKSEEELVENTKLTSESGGGNEDDCFMSGYLQADACTALRAREYFKEKEQK